MEIVCRRKLEMLGHASLEPTEIDTKISIAKLQQIHAATHPATRMEHRAASDSRDGDRAEPLAALGEATDAELDLDPGSL